MFSSGSGVGFGFGFGVGSGSGSGSCGFVILFIVNTILLPFATDSPALILCLNTTPSSLNLSSSYIICKANPLSSTFASASVFPTTFGTVAFIVSFV